MKKINKKMNGYEDKATSFKKKVLLAESNAILRTDPMSDADDEYGIYMHYAGSSRLMYVSKSALFHDALQEGMTLGELRRWKPGRGTRDAKLEGMFSHVLDVADHELEQILEGEPDAATIEFYINRRFDLQHAPMHNENLPWAA